MSQAARERFAKKSEADDLRRAFDKLDSKGDGKIDADEIAAMFNKLGHKAKRVSEQNWRCKPPDPRKDAYNNSSFVARFKRERPSSIAHTGPPRTIVQEIVESLQLVQPLFSRPTARELQSNAGSRSVDFVRETATDWHAQAEIDDMIWEVDEDCDKAVKWPEFQQMYHRCRHDKTGYEPRRLYNIVEFMMNDKDDSGTVSAEEAMQILYMRFGRTLLDSVSRFLGLF